MPVIDEGGIHPSCRPIEYEIKKNGCWECISHAERKAGYFDIQRNNKKDFMHRYIYKYFKGFKDKKKHVLHTCDNNKCINPKHLYEGNDQDNTNDKMRRNRQARVCGEKNGRAKLTERNVMEIKKMLKNTKKTQKEIAKKFNVNDAQISRIKKNQTWSHMNN